MTEKKVSFGSILRAAISLVLMITVIVIAFLIFSNMKKKQEAQISSAQTVAEATVQFEGESSESGEIAEKSSQEKKEVEDKDSVYLVKGNDKSSNRFERADKLCYTNTYKYTLEDLSQLDAYGLRITRNEIYARHGRMFADQDLQTYFDRQSWYVASVSPENFNDSCFNDIENYNLNLIVQYEMEY